MTTYPLNFEAPDYKDKDKKVIYRFESTASLNGKEVVMYRHTDGHLVTIDTLILFQRMARVRLNLEGIINKKEDGN